MRLTGLHLIFLCLSASLMRNPQSHRSTSPTSAQSRPFVQVHFTHLLLTSDSCLHCREFRTFQKENVGASVSFSHFPLLDSKSFFASSHIDNDYNRYLNCLIKLAIAVSQPQWNLENLDLQVKRKKRIWKFRCTGEKKKTIWKFRFVCKMKENNLKI